MALKPHQTERGLWVDDELDPQGPGVHALIIGVSRYDHLEKGALTKAGAETYGLGQLAVSALTALRFFGWLRGDYALSGWPLARVRLLLAPQKKGVGLAEIDELDGCVPEIVDWAGEATFDACKTAIRRWYADMKGLKAPARARSLFFFSGHGIQLSRANQLLLPSDYADPAGGKDEAIKTQNLFDCLSSLVTAPSHIVLLDACRNDVEKLRKVDGTNVIDESESPGDPRLELRVLRATAFGLRAYQPTTQGGMSLFGQALLDGLSGRPNPVLGEPAIELSRRGSLDTVEISNLQTYMNGRIDALIKAANEAVIQVVRADDSQIGGARIDVTEVSKAPPPDASAGGDRFVEEVVFHGVVPGEGVGWRGRPATEAMLAPPAKKKRRTAAQLPGAWFQKRYGEQYRAPDDGLTETSAYPVLGSEAFSVPWGYRQLEGLSTAERYDRGKLQLVSAAQTGHDGKLHGIQAHLRVARGEDDDPVGYLLTIDDFGGHSFSTILPADPVTRSFQLEIDRIGTSYIRFASFLSAAAEDDPKGAIVAAVWDKMRARSAQAAAKVLKAKGTAAIGERALLDSARSPLSAVVGTALLLRANRLDLMSGWTRNLASWFETIPDGVVFWMEQCRREARAELGPDASAWFIGELQARSLPFTCDAFGMAVGILGEIERGHLPSDGSTREAACHLRERFDAVMPSFRDDGLFCAYVDIVKDRTAMEMLRPPAMRLLERRDAPLGVHRLKPTSGKSKRRRK